MNRIFRQFSLVTSLTIALAVMLGAAYAQNKNVKVVPVQSSPTVNGADLYRQYCAVCHGTDGQGAGPAAEALRQHPSDLTQLTRHNNGKFPTLKVQGILKGQNDILSHGNQEMPVWGDLFRSVTSNPSMVTLKIESVTAYLQQIQK